MSDLNHYHEDVGGIQHHVIELPPIVEADELLNALDRLLRESMTTPGAIIRIDCRRVTRICESAIGILMAAGALRPGGRIRLDVQANSRLHELFMRTGLGPREDDDQRGSAGVPSPDVKPPVPKGGGYAEPRPSDNADSPGG